MKLIADSGGTKTDWAVIADDGLSEIRTSGINPIHQSKDEIRRILADELLPYVKSDNISDVFFYGSGCRGTFVADMQSLFQELFSVAGNVEIDSDLLGAARALCGRSEGIACILGTGANSCYYDGVRIVKNTPAMGYILGDEGSGAVLGRNFLNALFKGFLPESLKCRFCEENHTSLDDIIENVYKKPLANRFLASLTVFVKDHIDVDGVRSIVIDNFRAFFLRNIKPYGMSHLPVNVIGSLVCAFSEEFEAAAAMEGYRVGKIEQRPLKGLVDYHR